MTADTGRLGQGAIATPSIWHDALSPEQVALLDVHRRRWSKLCLSTTPVDRAAAESGVVWAYRAAGMASPKRIVWCGGPIKMARIWESAKHDASFGPNLRNIIVDQIRDRSERDLARLLGAAPKRALLEQPRSLADSVGEEVVQAVTRRARHASPHMSARMRQLLSTLIRLKRPTGSWAAFNRSSISPIELGWLWPSRFVHECCGRHTVPDQLRGLWLIATETGWMLPHSQVCWLAERPSVLSWDVRGRLHGARGPALAYPDGWSYYAWKGVEVPAALIEQQDKITLRSIDREPDPIIRRTMIDIITPARFVAMGGAVRAAQDNAGILWRKSWWTGDNWAAVEVVNGTQERDGTHHRYFLQVPAELRTARAAVAWTYGMSEDQYTRLVVRT